MPENSPQPPPPSGISWAAMLVLLFLAIAAACGLAWWIIYPYTHRHSL